MRGSKPTPAHLKLLAGNPGHRGIKHDEVQVLPLQPSSEPPEFLTKMARKEWRRMVPLLVESNLLSMVDLASFSMYCQAYGRWMDAEAALKAEGSVVMDRFGFPKINPQQQIADKAMDQVRQFGTEFGLTPSSRSRVKAGPSASTEDPFAEFRANG